jgi:transcriptional regulator with XRE-family HTH domain
MLRLRLEREKQGLSQQKMGYRAEICPATISRIERGKIYPYPGWRKRLAKALGWPEEQADKLFEEVTEEATKE